MATATQSAHNKELDPQKRSSASRHFEEELRQRFPTELERFGPLCFEQQCLFDAA